VRGTAAFPRRGLIFRSRLPDGLRRRIGRNKRGSVFDVLTERCSGQAHYILHVDIRSRSEKSRPYRGGLEMRLRSGFDRQLALSARSVCCARAAGRKENGLRRKRSCGLNRHSMDYSSATALNTQSPANARGLPLHRRRVCIDGAVLDRHERVGRSARGPQYERGLAVRPQLDHAL
jgi:hypothetical protein